MNGSLEKFENLKEFLEKFLGVELGGDKLEEVTEGFRREYSFMHSEVPVVRKHFAISMVPEDLKKIDAREETVESVFAKAFMEKSDKIELFRNLEHLETLNDCYEKTKERNSFIRSIHENLSREDRKKLDVGTECSCKMVKLAKMSRAEMELEAATFGI